MSKWKYNKGEPMLSETETQKLQRLLIKQRQSWKYALVGHCKSSDV